MIATLFLAVMAAAMAVCGSRFHLAIPAIVCGICLVPGVRHLRQFFTHHDMERLGKKIEQFKTGSEPKNPGYFWAGQSINFDAACKHFVTVGATGSGKSVMLNMLLQSVLLKMGPRSSRKRRALVYDAKADLYSFMKGVNANAEILILNPLDRRFSPWDIAADVVSETDAYEFASILIPRNANENNPYFNDTARNLVAGVIKRFIAEGRAWTLRDLVLAFESLPRLEAVLDHEETRYLQDHFDQNNDRNLAGVKSTVDNTMALYRPIAALCASAKQPAISLRKWIQSQNSVLLLGNHESAREATDTLNRLIFHQLYKLLIARDGHIKEDETWIFLDEVREAGRLSGLRQLLLRGRSKGVAVALGFQDIKGIYAAYGDHDGAEIVGAAQNIVVLHINPSAPATAEWAASIFGTRRDVVRSDSEQMGQNYSMGTSKQAIPVPNLLPVQLMQLHMPAQDNGISYYAYTNASGHISSNYDWEFLERAGPFNCRDWEAADLLEQKDPERFRLQPWNGKDVVRLGLPAKVLDASRKPIPKNTPPKPSTGDDGKGKETGSHPFH